MKTKFDSLDAKDKQWVLESLRFALIARGVINLCIKEITERIGDDWGLDGLEDAIVNEMLDNELTSTLSDVSFSLADYLGSDYVFTKKVLPDARLKELIKGLLSEE